MSTLVWIFLFMCVAISSFVTWKITSMWYKIKITKLIEMQRETRTISQFMITEYIDVPVWVHRSIAVVSYLQAIGSINFFLF